MVLVQTTSGRLNDTSGSKPTNTISVSKTSALFFANSHHISFQILESTYWLPDETISSKGL